VLREGHRVALRPCPHVAVSPACLDRVAGRALAMALADGDHLHWQDLTRGEPLWQA
jgi:hypothetical protein